MTNTLERKLHTINDFYICTSERVRRLHVVKLVILKGRKETTKDVVHELHAMFHSYILSPQWGAADTEIKVSSGENTELTHSPLKTWSRSVFSHTCYAYCQGCLPCLFLPSWSIHLHFFSNLSRSFLCWLWLKNRPPFRIQVPILSARGI